MPSGLRSVVLGCALPAFAASCGLRADTGTGSEGGAANQRATPEAENSASSDEAPEQGPPLSGTQWQRGVALRGAYAYALEGSVFLSCGSSDFWWTELEGLALERFQDVAFDLGCEERGCLFAAAGEGDVSPPGRYGLELSYVRSVTFTRLTSFSVNTLARDLAALNAANCEVR